MANFIVKTGFGYLKDSGGNIITKCELPPGKHPIKGGLTYVEVSSQVELDLIEIYVSPPSAEDIREQKIQAEMRKLAEDSLREKGEL